MKIEEFSFLQDYCLVSSLIMRDIQEKIEWCVFHFFSFLIVDDFFFLGKYTHTREEEWGFNIKTHHKLYSKVIITIKWGWLEQLGEANWAKRLLALVLEWWCWILGFPSFVYFLFLFSFDNQTCKRKYPFLFSFHSSVSFIFPLLSFYPTWYKFLSQHWNDKTLVTIFLILYIMFHNYFYKKKVSQLNSKFNA